MGKIISLRASQCQFMIAINIEKDNEVSYRSLVAEAWLTSHVSKSRISISNRQPVNFYKNDILNGDENQSNYHFICTSSLYQKKS